MSSRECKVRFRWICQKKGLFGIRTFSEDKTDVVSEEVFNYLFENEGACAEYIVKHLSPKTYEIVEANCEFVKYKGGFLKTVAGAGFIAAMSGANENQTKPTTPNKPISPVKPEVKPISTSPSLTSKTPAQPRPISTNPPAPKSGLLGGKTDTQKTGLLGRNSAAPKTGLLNRDSSEKKTGLLNRGTEQKKGGLLGSSSNSTKKSGGLLGGSSSSHKSGGLLGGSSSGRKSGGMLGGGRSLGRSVGMSLGKKRR